MKRNVMHRDSETVSAIMARVRSRNTGPELQLTKALRTRNLRFLQHSKDLPGRPDIVFPNAKLAVFVNGDFWHGRQWRNRDLKTLAAQFRHSANRSYWIKKITANMRRVRVESTYGKAGQPPDPNK